MNDTFRAEIRFLLIDLEIIEIQDRKISLITGFEITSFRNVITLNGSPRHLSDDPFNRHAIAFSQDKELREGLEGCDILPAITATTTVIDSMDYRSVYSEAGDEELALRDLLEGTVIPETTIKTKEHLVHLMKRGRMLVASYEAIRFQKLDLFGVMLRQIGAHIQTMQLMDALQVLTDGDGNNNSAMIYNVGSSPISGTAGTLGYDQLVEFWGQFDPYTMNTMLCSTATMTKMLKIPELQNPLTGLNFQGSGKLAAPLGAQLHRTSAVADGVIIGLDNRYALELVRAGDVLVEYDKLIDRQLERAAITSISGFGKICDGAACVLNV